VNSSTFAGHVVVGLADDDRRAGEELDVAVIAAVFAGLGAVALDVLPGVVERPAPDEHGLGVAAAERTTGLGAAGLVEHRCALP
jgi:hypothetical protein